MKRKSLILPLVFLHAVFMLFSDVGQAQSYEWTWMKGDSIRNVNGVYGNLGVANAANKPGARTESVCWTDKSGNFWLFGGQGYAASGGKGYLNDLWEYNPGTNQWTWVSGDSTKGVSGNYGVQGVASPANKPGSRAQAAAWNDISGDTLWLFGGYQSGGVNEFSDLWKYDINNNLWTWVKGNSTLNANGVYGVKGTAAATNLPGGRHSHTTWTDASGNLWLFGGYAYPVSPGGRDYLDDLWEYNPKTTMWTWVNGSSTTGQTAKFGTRGLSALTNSPGGRAQSHSWEDKSGNFWIFGGYGYDATNSWDVLNDLWEYNPGTNQWTWMKGDTIRDKNGIYGALGIANSSNKPGSRYMPFNWTDLSGNNLWLFGGTPGYPQTGGSGYLNDMMKFDITANQWTWMNGDSVINKNGNYGTLLTPGCTSKPGGRGYSVGWTDKSGNLWLFGGLGYPASGGTGDLNDLWKYGPAVSYTVSAGPDQSGCPGNPFALSASGAANYVWTPATLYVVEPKWTFQEISIKSI